MRKLMFFLALGLCAQMTWAQDLQQKSSAFKVNGSDAAMTKILFKLRQDLPGLDKYAASIGQGSIEHDYYLSIVFNVSQDGDFPSYLGPVAGNTCTIELNKRNDAFRIAKTWCRALAFDKSPDGTTNDQWFKLR